MTASFPLIVIGKTEEELPEYFSSLEVLSSFNEIATIYENDVIVNGIEEIPLSSTVAKKLVTDFGTTEQKSRASYDEVDYFNEALNIAERFTYSDFYRTRGSLKRLTPTGFEIFDPLVNNTRIEKLNVSLYFDKLQLHVNKVKALYDIYVDNQKTLSTTLVGTTPLSDIPHKLNYPYYYVIQLGLIEGTNINGIRVGMKVFTVVEIPNGQIIRSRYFYV